MREQMQKYAGAWSVGKTFNMFDLKILFLLILVFLIKHTAGVIMYLISPIVILKNA